MTNEEKFKKCLGDCKLIKNINLFHKSISRADGLNDYCKECKALKAKEYRDRNKERLSKERKEKYRNNLEKYRKQKRDSYQRNKENVIAYQHRYYEENKEYVLAKCKDYRETHKEEKLQRDLKYCKERRSKDPAFKIRHNISKSIWYYLIQNNSSKNGNSTWSKLPYTPQQLKEHLESQFEPWMTWENYGIASSGQKTWQIDHVIPQSKLIYDSMDHPNFLECWKLENLRPLDAFANIRKGNKFL